jgi:hypothetical protein
MSRFTLSMVVCLGLLASVPVLAQKITGDISGTITDPSGAAVRAATVRAENTATGEKASATTNDTGFYRLVNLSPGQYKLAVEAQGFKTSERPATVSIALTTQADFALQVGGTNEIVLVEGVAPLVETTEDRLSTLFVGRQVEDLPNNGRDFNNLLDGVPGVQRAPGGGFQSLNINGQRATSNNFAIDGIPNNDRYYGESALGQAAIAGTAAALIALEGISEFNVQSNPGAEYGVRGGSVINVGLKSGTNQLHGSAFWDRHTDAFDARNYFATAVTPFRLNQYGATVGFPIKKDKTFGIVSFQGFHLKDVFPSLVDVPTPAEISDATQCVITGVNPDTAGSGLPCLNIGPGPGSDQIYGTADDGTVNSIGDALLSFIPTSPTGQLNVRAENVLDLTSFHVKVDHIFNQSHRVSVKYLFSDSFGNQPAAPGVLQSAGSRATNNNMWNSVAPSRAQLAGVNYTWTISPTKVLESRLGYTRFSQRIGINNNINPADLGLNTGPLGAGPSDTENFGVPAVYYLGYFGNIGYSVVGGVQGYPIITRPDATYDWQEHFTAIKGNHTIKVGGQYQDAYTKSRRDRSRSDLSFYYYGFYYCSTGTYYYPVPGCNDLSGAGQGDHVAALNELLLGLTEGSGRSFGVTNRHISQKSLGLYVQDSWKVKPNFTLEMGVRWDIAGALGEHDNLGANFLPDDPAADADGFVTLSKRSLYNKDKNNFGPRFGFAWDMFKNSKTVLRGGYSLSYDLPNFATIHAPQTYSNAFAGTRAGFYTQVAEGNFPIQIFSTPDSNKAIFNGGTQRNSLCDFFICMAAGVNIYGQSIAPSPPFNIVQVLPDFQTPINHAYNLTIEQELNNKMALSVAYVGTAGRDLVSWRDMNACPISTLDCDNSRKPFGSTFPQYDHILRMTNDAYSNYNALQTAFKVREMHGLTGQFNFVWSRTFDTGSANRGGDFLTQYQNPYNIDKNYGPSNFDTPWNVNFTLVYDIPRLQSLPKLVGGGWQINSIFRAQEGRPFTPFIRGDPSNQGLRSTFADYNGAPLNYDFHYLQDGKDGFLNTTAFSVPQSGTVGNAGRNMLRQPGISQLDMSIFKNFELNERLTVRFSWAVFNVLNHGMFATTQSGTGRITTCPIDSATGQVQPGPCSAFGQYFATPDVGIGFNPVLGTGAQRNMQFGLKVSF